MGNRGRLASYCRLTCLGGSERGTCPCASPAACEMREVQGFEEARAEAITRMLRMLRKIPKEECDDG
jgi:hypothetical protein